MSLEDGALVSEGKILETKTKICFLDIIWTLVAVKALLKMLLY